jgi:twitching motility protein PilT
MRVERERLQSGRGHFVLRLRAPLGRHILKGAKGYVVPRADGRGRCVAMEVCITTGRVAEAIADQDKTATIPQLVSEGGFYGMQTFDQHLIALYRDSVITLDAALEASTSPHDLTVELRRLGLVG